MNKKRNSAVLILVSLVVAGFLLLFTAAFMFVLTAGGSAGGTLASGRSVMAYSDSLFLETSLSGEIAVIKTGGIEITVKPDSVWVDQKLLQKIDVDAMDIQIHVENGSVRVDSEGAAGA